MRFVSSQICVDRRVFYAQMMSCAVRYDVLYHPFPILSIFEYMGGCDSPVEGTFCDNTVGRLYISNPYITKFQV